MNLPRIRLPGFTLMEILITMIISSLVIGGCYWAFSRFQLNSQRNHETLDSAQELISFYSVFKHDWELADGISHINMAIQFTGRDRSITYDFMDSCVHRTTDERSESFNLNAHILQCERLNSTEISDIGCIRALALMICRDGDTLQLNFTKEYSPWLDLLLQINQVKR